jgi:hypothetical protein
MTTLTRVSEYETLGSGENCSQAHGYEKGIALSTPENKRGIMALPLGTKWASLDK